MLIALLSAAAGHALARPVENMLAECMTILAWLDGNTRCFRLEVEPVEFPNWLWWEGTQGFIAQRIPVEEPGKD